MKLRLILLLVVIMYLFSCSKEQDTDNYPFENVNYLNELVSIDNDVTKALGIFTGEDFEACGVTDTSYNELANIYALFFDGNSCNNKIYRKGRIDVQLLNGSTWFEVNAQIKVTFVNLELRDINTGVAVVVAGSRTYTNLTGDLDILDLVEGSNELMRKVESSDLSISYGDGTSRAWNESYFIRTRRANFEYYFEILGDPAAPYTEATSWGVNRAGRTFYTIPTIPIKATLCFSGSTWVTTGGEVLIHTDNKPTTQIIHGLDNLGNVSSDPCFANSMKVIWTDDSGEVHQALKQYY